MVLILPKLSFQTNSEEGAAGAPSLHVIEVRACLEDSQPLKAFRQLPKEMNTELHVFQEIAGEETTAQVHPQRLTEAFLEAAQEQGAQLKLGKVDGLRIQDNCIQGKG